MAVTADTPKRKAYPAQFWLRGAFLASGVAMGLVIWASHSYLTRTIAEEQSADSTVRATLYAASVQSAVQRLSFVPVLLSRDPILMNALAARSFDEAEERLSNFREEIGSGSIFLLDAEGAIVAASDPRPASRFDGHQDVFVRPAAAPEAGSVFSMIEHDTGPNSFLFTRKIEDVNGAIIGFVSVSVDLALQEEYWRRNRAQVALTTSDGLILLASEPSWRKQNISELLSIESPPDEGASLGLGMTAPSNSSPFVTVFGTPHLRADVPVGLGNWRMSYFSTLDDVRARVNAILAIMMTVLALLAASASFLLMRRTRVESRRIQRESEELRLLNRRLSAEIAARQRVERNLKDAEQSLEQASKLAALGQMSAAVSHELNQPLAAMKTYLAGARLLLQRRRPDEALSSFQRIDDLIERMGGITRQLKSYARKSDADLEPIDLRDSVRAALSMMAPQLGKMAVTITTTLPSEPVIVVADALRIEQIIVNLLRNALDAVKGIDDRRVKIFLVTGETILLSIEDNGPGLKDPGKLFEPFYTTKKPGEGLGLGLAISAGFAGELGGRLVARNAPDGGAVFELVLPRDRGHRQAAE